MGTQQEQVSLIASVRVRKLRFVDLWSEQNHSYVAHLVCLVAMGRGGIWYG